MKGHLNSEYVPASFRDPSGFLFKRGGSIYRQVNTAYKENFDYLTTSGLYEALVNEQLLIPHDVFHVESADSDKAYKIIRPELVEFISYPYEWCFSQLKDAALTTLRVHKKAFDFGMSLRDCSAYNVQFRKGKPIFIDTLSFEKYHEGQPWVAYRQFCQHFLAPLALMSYRDVRLNQLLRVYIDGVPLDLASSLLPLRTRFSLSLLTHIHIHARSQKHYASRSVDTSRYKINRLAFLGLVDNLESAIGKLKWQPKGTEWVDYYKDTNYSEDALQHKKEIVAEFLDKLRPKNVWDLGGNVGIFSRIASDKGIPTISFDIDPAAIERSYLECVSKGETNILPLLEDLTNPSSGIGWAGTERMSLMQRGPADTVLALALVHHLAISNNVPFNKLADFFSKICRSLIIEFVPKNDSHVKSLLVTREDIFPDYTQAAFERAFGPYFAVLNSLRIKDSERVLYLMQSSKSLE
jgi:ribosomal protein L11 methylase PrmA